MGLSHAIDRSDPRVVRLAGELDRRVAGEVVDLLADAVLDGSPARLVVDLGQVSRLDATGVVALLTVQRIAANQGCTLVLANPSAAVRELLAATGVHDLLAADQPQPTAPKIPESGLPNPHAR